MSSRYLDLLRLTDNQDRSRTGSHAHEPMPNRLRSISTLVTLAFCAAASCSHSRDSVRHTRTFSYGFEDAEMVYFLLEYRVSRPRAPVWFIMPIERRPEVFFHELYLYRYDQEAGRLEKLGTVRDEFFPGGSIAGSKFTKDEDRIIFAYRTGHGNGYSLLFEVRIFDVARDRLLPPDPNGPAPADSAIHRRYFEDYVSPYRDNPGIVGIAELKERLSEVAEEEWDLPHADEIIRQRTKR